MAYKLDDIWCEYFRCFYLYRDKIEILFRDIVESMYLQELLNERIAMETSVKSVSAAVRAAVRAAALKREKKAAGVAARRAGKVAAAERRAAADSAWDALVRDERAAIEKKVASARKAMGVRKNEETPDSIIRLISVWESEMFIRLSGVRSKMW